MQRDFWLGRWERGEIGWHQSEVEPALVQYFSTLKPGAVLVPLCGKSRDLRWLADQGHHVLGIDVSELAVRAFFREQNLSYHERRVGSFQLLQSDPLSSGGKITLLQGDFFELNALLLRELSFEPSALYDRAALIALPPDMRVRYARQIQALVRASASSGFTQLQVVLERMPQDLNGPPFSVPESELRGLYQGLFQVESLHREQLETTPEGPQVYECVYRMTLGSI